MEFGTNRLKVVWICHFSNSNIQGKLKINHRIPEFAPWITLLIELFKNENIELHIISPHEYLKSYKTFSDNNIYYHFYNSGIPFWGRHWPAIFKFDYLTGFFTNKLIVRKIVSKIHPDIIHLHGAENAYYSSSILQFIKKYPLMVTIQGFIGSSSNKSSRQVQQKINCEKKILQSIQNFGIRARFMEYTIHSNNREARFFWHNYPINKPSYTISEKSQYDLVYFARISKDKGIEDLLKAVYIIKKQIPSLTLLVIGHANQKYTSFLVELCKQYNILQSIEWKGFIETQEKMYEIVSKAKISVLPTHHDIIPGTVIESMFMKLPVVSYAVGGLPDINEKGECIKLVNKSDVNGLAEAIVELLFNNELRKELAENAYQRANEMYNNSEIPFNLIKAYTTIIDNFKNKTNNIQ
jgi:glycosyltransferase involved in cell wall biosynthesis